MTWDIVGHDWAVTLLDRRLATGRVAHSYLFTGPPQVGKTRLALSLAQALNCQAEDRPCGRCRSCLKIEANSHPDVRLIAGEGAGGSFKIDQIRLLQHEAALFPYESRWRVLILERMDLASAEAANSLLKTLEEPPGHVVLILTAVDPEALPATVVSRCQRLDLRPVGRAIVEQALRARSVAEQKARVLAGLSAGRIGWALQASHDDGVLSRRQQDLDHLVRLLTAGRVERLESAARLGRDPDSSRELLELWAAWWRDLLLLCGRGDGRLVNVDRDAELRSLARRERLPQVWAALRALQATAEQLQANVNPRLAMEGLLLRLPHWAVGDGQT